MRRHFSNRAESRRCNAAQRNGFDLQENLWYNQPLVKDICARLRTYIKTIPTQNSAKADNASGTERY